MHVVSYNNSPMLSRVRILPNSLGDGVTNDGLLGEPFSSRSSNRMPAQLDSSLLAIDIRLAMWNNTGPVTETQRVLEVTLCFDGFLLAFREAILTVCKSQQLAREVSQTSFESLRPTYR